MHKKSSILAILVLLVVGCTGRTKFQVTYSDGKSDTMVVRTTIFRPSSIPYCIEDAAVWVLDTNLNRQGWSLYALKSFGVVEGGTDGK